jgi:hypothetical protein
VLRGVEACRAHAERSLVPPRQLVRESKAMRALVEDLRAELRRTRGSVLFFMLDRDTKSCFNWESEGGGVFEEAPQRETAQTDLWTFSLTDQPEQPSLLPPHDGTKDLIGEEDDLPFPPLMSDTAFDDLLAAIGW